MTTTTRPLSDLVHEAVDLLCRELGVANTLRVLRQLRQDTGNYMEDREDIPLEELIAAARRIEETRATR